MPKSRQHTTATSLRRCAHTALTGALLLALGGCWHNTHGAPVTPACQGTHDAGSDTASDGDSGSDNVISFAISHSESLARPPLDSGSGTLALVDADTDAPTDNEEKDAGTDKTLPVMQHADHSDDVPNESPPCIRSLEQLLTTAPPARLHSLPGFSFETLEFRHYKIQSEFKRFMTCRIQRQLHQALAKGERWYFPLVERIAREEAPHLLDASSDEIPIIRALEAKLVTESLLQTNAISWAGAAGPWQFMRPTVRRFLGRMKVADRYPLEDLRFDWATATRAALLLNLENMHIFRHTRSPFTCAVMAYNAGSKRVGYTLRSQGKSDCRSLRFSRHHRRRWIPTETYRYHPRIVLILLLRSWRESHGYSLAPQADLPGTYITGSGAVRLKDVALAAQLDEQELLALNRIYPLGVTPNDHWRLRVPQGAGPAVSEAMPSVPRMSPKHLSQLITKAGALDHTTMMGSDAFRYYRIRRGDTVSHICRRYRISMWKLYKLNQRLFDRNKRRSRRKWTIYPGQKLKLPALHRLVRRS